MLNNLLLQTDSYKASHWKQYPKGTEYIYSYLESRGANYPFESDHDYCIFFGLQYLIKRHLVGQVVTKDKIDEAALFYNKHFGNENMFNRSGWEYILEKHNGRLPIEIKAVPEGSKITNRNALITIVNTDPECFWLTNFLETLLVRVWYPITVSTLSYSIKQIIGSYLDKTAKSRDGLVFKLHDFGYRGVSSGESAAIGGAAHLINFTGTDTLAGCELLMEYYNTGMPGFSIPACYDDKTEILTNFGFIKFSELSDNYKIAQYNNGTIDFVSNPKIHTHNNVRKLIRFRGKYCDLNVTLNHRMVRKSKKTGKLEVFEAQKASYSHRNTLIKAGIGVGEKRTLSDIDKLKIAFQADGSFPSRDAYNGNRSKCLPIRFSLKKKRKVKRLDAILETLELEYSKNKNDNTGYYSYWIKIPKNINMSKKLDWVNFEDISESWAKEFIEECSYWDGSRPTKNVIQYSSTEKYNVDIVQAIATLANYRSNLRVDIDKRQNRKSCYNLSICKHTNDVGGQYIEKEEINYNGDVYCVTVPSGMVVVRRNNIVSISGNSEHSTITSWGRENELEAYANMLDQYPDGLVACVSDSYDIYNACKELWGTQLKEQIINRNGTLVIRLDSGDPIEVVLKCLNILGESFGYELVNNTYKLLPDSVRIIQGDGIDKEMVKNILQAMTNAGWSSENIAFGSGGALLQKLNRDSLSFAFKCCHAQVNGESINVLKDPITDPGKKSKAGRLTTLRNVVTGDIVTRDRLDLGLFESEQEIMRTVFRNGKLLIDEKLADIRFRLEQQ